MKIAIFIIYSVIILFVSCEKKGNTSVLNEFHTNIECGSTVETNECKNNEQIHNTENLNLEKPIVIEINGLARFLEFPNSRRVNINEYILEGSFLPVKVYSNASREASYDFIIDAASVLLFSLPETEDWLYLYTYYIDDPSFYTHGFVNVYDLHHSVTFIRNNENKIFERLPNARRYGPLLEIRYNTNIKKFWDSYDEEMGRKSYRLVDCYEGYDEILIGWQYGAHGQDEAFFVYNMRLDTIYELGGNPVYNSSRDMAFCFSQRSNGISLFVYRIIDDIYEKTAEEVFFQEDENIYISTYKWINDNEFEIVFRNWFNTTEKSVIGRKSRLTFDLIYNE